ncbi:UvrD-helicase domain-containing protein [Aliifodinibius sp. S!AR15-10]|uniref:ATP-dependent helicase n=1 Tax=Aliifodinibius sp. S!AR15-10 TaxID=2950437 RepID=UPI002858698B|nr:UvrD-helicase domain-containing protein [Aliifodinibius sp. S!AR15-10]MDR8391093.1 UvrD-helicase domain-containing protein [Aliifodinibius sp. S!AR15-10]
MSQEPDFIKDLNKQQQDAVKTTDGPLLIVAGAGSGKTRVLTYRIAYLIHQQKAQPNEILALTFTNKAAREMKDRIIDLIGDEARHLWMGTFHSVFSKILRYEAEKIGFDSSYSIYDTDDSQNLIKQIIRELNYDPKEIQPRTIQRRISDSKNELIMPDQYREKFVHSTLDDITARIYEIYSNRLQQNNAMDFDDLLIKPIRLFRENPDVLEKYQDRFRYILIDEYQDTNHAQYTVTRMLANKHENICVVGDDAQSIYSFRGADISNILNFKKDYEEAVQVPLEQNYRSTKYILQAADSIIKNNDKQLDKTLWTDNEEGSTITLLENYDERDEANRVAGYIRDLKARHGYGNNDFAILYRTNYQSRVFEETLRRKGIAYQLVGGLSFYQRKEVKDILAYLTILVNPDDDTNLLRIINEPSRGIGNKSLHQLTSQSRSEHKSLWDVLTNVEEVDIYGPAENSVKDFVAMIRGLNRDLDNGKSLVDVTKKLLEKSGYMKSLVEENSPKSMTRRENILELQNAISYYEKGNKNPSLANFLQEISLITDTDKYDEEKPAVTMMTVHAAKGLEFPVVFVVGLEEDLFPVGSRNNEDVDIEEERRLFYVAITRAERDLFFSFCRSRYKYGEEKSMMRSRFLDEVDSGVVRTETGASINQVQNRYQEDSSSANNWDKSVEYDWKKPHYSKNNRKSRKTTIHYDGDDIDRFQVGAKVEHNIFGPGKIISRTGNGEKTKVVVFFKDRGRKTLMLRAAKMKVVG